MGNRYITNNLTGHERSESEFFHNTEGKCSFCGETVIDIFNVGRFLTDDSFLCTDCFTVN